MIYALEITTDGVLTYRELNPDMDSIFFYYAQYAIMKLTRDAQYLGKGAFGVVDSVSQLYARKKIKVDPAVTGALPQ